MARVKYNPEEVDLLARLILGEAGGEGTQGMQNAGNVMINRVVAGSDPNAEKNCSDFGGINTITKMVYQKSTPKAKYHEFNAVDYPPFYNPPNPEAKEVAQEVIDGLRIDPAKHALWFLNPAPEKECMPTFFSAVRAGKWKNHCFYNPAKGQCPQVLS